MPIHRLDRPGLASRDAKIGLLAKQGVALDGLAIRFGLTKGQVRRVLNRSNSQSGIRPRTGDMFAGW